LIAGQFESLVLGLSPPHQAKRAEELLFSACKIRKRNKKQQQHSLEKKSACHSRKVLQANGLGLKQRRRAVQ
jgi:hypothetical protein